jgi:hypothetical protein
MMQRPAGIRAANDNVSLLHRAAARSAQDLLRMPIIPRRDPLPQLASPQFHEDGHKRPYAFSLLTAGFSGLFLVALSGACLVALAAVGVLAAVVGGFDLVRRQIWRPARPPLSLDHQVAGYPGRP